MSLKKSIILIVDDEASIRRVLCATLTSLGFDVIEAARGQEALGLIRSASIDVILLDVNMPGMNGIEVCRQLRQYSSRVPIVMVTVRDAYDEKVEALDAGADDYVTKPFNMRELMARLRAVLRRAAIEPQKGDSQSISIGEIVLYTEERILLKDGKPVSLTPKEFDILRCLMQRPGRTVTRKHLLTSVWGSDYRNNFEYLRTYVSQIRKKIEDDPSNPSYLLTDLWVGYRFCEADQQIAIDNRTAASA